MFVLFSRCVRVIFMVCSYYFYGMFVLFLWCVRVLFMACSCYSYGVFVLFLWRVRIVFFGVFVLVTKCVCVDYVVCF